MTPPHFYKLFPLVFVPHPHSSFHFFTSHQYTGIMYFWTLMGIGEYFYSFNNLPWVFLPGCLYPHLCYSQVLQCYSYPSCDVALCHLKLIEVTSLAGRQVKNNCRGFSWNTCLFASYSGFRSWPRSPVAKVCRGEGHFIYDRPCDSKVKFEFEHL